MVNLQPLIDAIAANVGTGDTPSNPLKRFASYKFMVAVLTGTADTLIAKYFPPDVAKVLMLVVSAVGTSIIAATMHEDATKTKANAQKTTDASAALATAVTAQAPAAAMPSVVRFSPIEKSTPVAIPAPAIIPPRKVTP